jgi:hypothetical protein
VGVAGFRGRFLLVAFLFRPDQMVVVDLAAPGWAAFVPVVAAFARSATGLRRRRRRRFAPTGAAAFAPRCFRERSPSATRRF